jgi:HPt (histidine-containing phosphotransfer) domain-containing protein
MKEEFKGERLYDLSNLEEISGGSQDFIQQMLQLFLEQSESTISGFRAALITQDLTTIRSLAHQIKPSIDNIKIHPLSKLIREVESAAEVNQPPQELESKILQSIQWLEKVNLQLREETR